MLKQVEEEKIDGFIKLHLSKDDKITSGKLIFKKGKPVASYYHGKEEENGEGSITSFIKDALDSEAILELHSYSYGSSSISIDHVVSNLEEYEVDADTDLDFKIKRVKRRGKDERSSELDRGSPPTRAKQREVDLEELYSESGENGVESILKRGEERLKELRQRRSREEESGSEEYIEKGRNIIESQGSILSKKAEELNEKEKQLEKKSSEIEKELETVCVIKG